MIRKRVMNAQMTEQGMMVEGCLEMLADGSQVPEGAVQGWAMIAIFLVQPGLEPVFWTPDGKLIKTVEEYQYVANSFAYSMASEEGETPVAPNTSPAEATEAWMLGLRAGALYAHDQKRLEWFASMTWPQPLRVAGELDLAEARGNG